MSIKRTLRAVLPNSIIRVIDNYRTKARYRRTYGGPPSARQVFSKIYEEGVWGRIDDPAQPFFSGGGSHHDAAVTAYVEAVRSFLSGFATKPDVADLGCGDFSIGSRIRPLCSAYTACDVVPKLIEFNTERYKALNVDFRLLDLIADELPRADVAFVRQVFQHLSNDQIAQALPKIASTYQYLIVTEHLPNSKRFKCNLDKPMGHDIRLSYGGGVVLTRPPFNLKPKYERELCRVSASGGVITTTAYRL